MLYNLNPLGKNEIEEILKAEAPQLPENVIRRLSEFADGYPRIAVLLSESYRAARGPSEEFLTISDEALMNRLIGGRSEITSVHFRTTKRVLIGLSLFRRIGYKGKLSKESEWVAKIMNVDWNNFKEVVTEEKRRGIIQGQHYIYVTPFMLRIHLLREWWESRGLTKESFNEFVESIPEEFKVDLLQRFFNHIPYISTTDRGKEFAKAILSKQGVFSDGSALKTKLGANFFLKLVEAEPRSALECLKRTVGRWTKEELLQFITGRREVVWALEEIAMWRDLFADAARLLLALGEAENETCSNNASGVFAQLFSPAPRPVAPTEASPRERFPVLKEALESSSKERRILALRACNQALESQHFVRTIGAEHQGLRKEPQLWKPKKYRELFDAYRQAWQLLRERLDSLLGDEQKQVVDILLQRARGLVRIQNLANMVIDTVNELAQKPYIDKKKMLAEITQILHYEGKGLPPQTRQHWEQLKDELTGRDFSSLMKRYVGMDLLEDKFDEQGKLVDQIQPRIEELAQRVIGNKGLLQPELEWLVTTEAQNGYRFGYELGKRDEDFSLLPTLLEAQRNAGKNSSAYFLGGYFRPLFEKSQKEWENQLDALVKDEKINVLIPELTFRSGMSDQAALRILNLTIKGFIDIGQFRMFVWGHAIKKLSEGIFKKLIHFLLGSSNTNAIFIAVELYFLYYVYGEPKHTLPKELTLKLLTHQLLFRKSEVGKRNQLGDYDWTEIGKAFVKHYLKTSLELADKMLEHFGEEGTIVEGFHSRTQTVLNEITRRYPKEAWMRITKYLGPPVDSRAFHIKEWLRGGEFFKEKDGALLLIPLERIWEWVDEDIEKRAWYLASFVPKRLFREEGKLCFAREVLVRYGEREDVRRNLMANFSTEGWTGPESLHYQKKEQQLLDFKKEEDNENVKSWIDDYVSTLEQRIERAKIEEKREDF